jgi:ABC-2 type transport system ATP-binding protein
MIGAGGLGYDVWQALKALRIGQGAEAGIAITLVAIVLDRISQRYAARRPIHELRRQSWIWRYRYLLVRDLRKSYGRLEAVRGISFEVQRGEVFGLLGPNGAGKTTLIKILTTLLIPTSGTAKVAGFDVVTETAKIRRVINMVAGGEQSGYGLLNVREQLWMFSQFYGLPNREGWRRVDELIDIVGLGEQRQQKVRSLSTGQRQKLNFARGLLNDPWVLFLDEPTLGLDVAAARDLREHTLAWKAAAPGRTLLLTTHYMVEAEQLCDRIAIVDRGKILALGTPEELRRRVQAESIFRIELDRLPENGGLAALASLPGVLSAVPADGDGTDAAGADRVALKVALADDSALTSVVTAVADRGSHLIGLAKSEPSLAAVVVELVGRGFGEDADDTEAPSP